MYTDLVPREKKKCLVAIVSGDKFAVKTKRPLIKKDYSGNSRKESKPEIVLSYSLTPLLN